MQKLRENGYELKHSYDLDDDDRESFDDVSSIMLGNDDSDDNE